MKKRLKRTKVNGAKKRTKANGAKINFPLGPERDKAILRKKAVDVASRIYEKWVNKFVNTRKRPDELADGFNDLSAKLFTELFPLSPDLYEYIWKELIMPCIQRSHELSEIYKQANVTVRGECPKCSSIKEVNVVMAAWIANAFHLECQCGGKIKAEDCRSVAPGKARATSPTEPPDSGSAPPARS